MDAPSETLRESPRSTLNVLSIAIIVVIILVVIVIVWTGLRLIEAMIDSVIGALGPATECGMMIETKQNAYVNQGMSKCDAYVKAINDAATSPHTPCPSPGGSPPAACGIYANYLQNVGCVPPAPCNGS